MYREIEEAVAFVAAYFYYKLPRNQVNQFAVKLANLLLESCQKINKLDEEEKNAVAKVNEAGDNQKPEQLTREMILEINMDGRLAAAIVEAALVFRIKLKQISALLPNAVQLRISEGMVSYTYRSNLICLYRTDGNMYHLHRRAHHTQLRPPLTLSTDENNRRAFTLITKDTFPRRRRNFRKKFTMINNSMQLRKVMKSAYFRCNNQDLPGPTRSAKLSGNGFMHPTLAPGCGRKWVGVQDALMPKTNKNEPEMKAFENKKNLEHQGQFGYKGHRNGLMQSQYPSMDLRATGASNKKLITNNAFRSSGFPVSTHRVSDAHLMIFRYL